MARRNSIIIRNIYPNWIFIQFNYKNSMTLNPKVDYINHPLNKSPSKTAYSFGHSVRFPGLESRDGSKQDNDQETHASNSRNYRREPPYQVLRRSRQRSRESPQKKGSRSKSPNRHKKKSSPSPGKRVTVQQSPPRHKGKIQSPGRKQRETSKQKKQRLTTSGPYYPLGIEINKEGKYVVSNYENVKTASFGHMSRERPSGEGSNLGPGYYDVVHKSPGRYVTSENKNMLVYSFPKSPRKGPEDPYSDPNFGPGMYRTFSQFGKYS